MIDATAVATLTWELGFDDDDDGYPYNPWEAYGEIHGQYRSEIALFGDAGPGQALDVQAAWEHAVEWEARVKALVAITPPTIVAPRPPVNDDEAF